MVFDEIDNLAVISDEEMNTPVEALSKCIKPFLAQLPDRYKEIMMMSELDNLSQKEIAERLDMNYTTVRSKVQRGRMKLKNLISNCCTVMQGSRGSILGYQEKRCKGDC